MLCYRLGTVNTNKYTHTQCYVSAVLQAVRVGTVGLDAGIWSAPVANGRLSAHLLVHCLAGPAQGDTEPRKGLADLCFRLVIYELHYS